MQDKSKDLQEERIKQLEDELLFLRNEKLKSISILEQDRQRIARDLHDTSLQDLSCMIHSLELASRYMDRDIVYAKLELSTIIKDLNRTINDIRNIIFDLRPVVFDCMNLKLAVERLLDQINIDCSFHLITDIDDIDFNDEIKAMAVFRIIQECVNNSKKHSRGTEIQVKIKDDNLNVDIEIKDNGTGFDQAKMDEKENHFGLNIIRERVFILSGKMTIDSSSGTRYHITIPK